MKTVLVNFYEYDKTEFLGSSIANSFVYSEVLNQSGEWSIEVDNQDFIESIDISNEVEIFVDGVLVLDARVSDKSYRIVDAGVTYTFSGRDRLDDLFLHPAVPSANFGIENGLNITFVGALAYLLDKANWRLGDIHTSLNEDDSIVIDLSGEKTLLSQITKLLSSKPDFYYRYGGFQTGYHTLDVGDFYEDIGEVLTNGNASIDSDQYFFIDDPDIKKKDEIIEGVYVQGGTFSGQASVHNPITDVNVYQNYDYPVTFGLNRWQYHRAVFLQDSSILPQYPIVETDFGENFLVLNSAVGNGGVIRNHPRFTDNSGPCLAPSFRYTVGTSGTSHVGVCQPLASPGGEISSFSVYVYQSTITPPPTYTDIRWKILDAQQVTSSNIWVPDATVLAQGTFTPSVDGGRKETITLGTPVPTSAGQTLFLCFELEGQEIADRGYQLQGVASMFSDDGVSTEDEGEAGNHLDKANEKNDCTKNHTFWGTAITLLQANNVANGDTDWQNLSDLTQSLYGLRFEMTFDRTLPRYPRVHAEFSTLVPYYGYYPGTAVLAAGQGWVFPLTALYEQAVRYLKRYSEPYFNFSGKIYGNMRSKVGDQVSVKGSWSVDQYDPISNSFTTIDQTLNIDLRLMSKKTSISISSESVEVSLNSKTIDSSQDSPTIALYDSLVSQRGSSEKGTIHVESFPPLVQTVSQASVGFSTFPSELMSDGRLGNLVTFATPTELYQFNYNALAYETTNTDVNKDRPNRLILAGLPYSTSGEALVVEVVQWPDIGTPLIARIAYADRPWSASETDTFNYYDLRLS